MIYSKLLIAFLVFILVFHAFATFNYWYWIYLWLDMPMHFLGGFWVAMAFVYLISKYQFPVSNEFLKQNSLSFFIVILSFVAFIGVSWEFYEFFSDIVFFSKGYLRIMQFGAADTIKDLFFDLLGGSVFLLIYRLIFKKKDII